jgi:hypothetical protein
MSLTAELLIGFGILIFVWMAYEIWRAPLLEMDDKGNWIVKKETKKLSDIFKKNKNKSNSSYSNLEKKGRGRSKY